MVDAWIPLPASVLAFATTVHVGFAVLRKHRTPAGTFPWALIPSIALAAGPWLFQSAAGIGLGIFAHCVWFLACEKLIPLPAAAASARLGGAISSPPRGTVGPVRADGSPFRSAGPSQPTPSKDFVAVSVLAVLDETPSIRTFRVVRPDGFVFQAGQFLTVRVQIDGKAHVRCYSISSAPEATGYLEVSVKRQGLVSGTLHATMRPGSQLVVRPPAGRFVYPANDDRPVVLVAGGVGITPMISMLRHAVAVEPHRPVTLLYSARGESELAFWDELCWLGRRHAQTRIVATLTDSGSGWLGRVGRIDGALLSESAADAAHAVFMICGPVDMIDAVRHSLESLGVPAAQIRSEVFQPAAAIGASLPSDQPGTDASGEDAIGKPPRLRLVKSNRTVDVAAQETLLEAAEGARVAIPSLCRAGVCLTCRTRVVSGEVHCSSDALTDRDRLDGYTLPCVAWARTDCALDA